MAMFLFNILRQEQSGRNFADEISKCIFLNANVWFSIKIYRSIASGNGVAPNRRNPLFEPMIRQFTGAYMRHPVPVDYILIKS